MKLFGFRDRSRFSDRPRRRRVRAARRRAAPRKSHAARSRRREIAADPPPNPRSSPKSSSACSANTSTTSPIPSWSTTRCAALVERARSLFVLSRRRGIRRSARQHGGHLRRHRHRSVDRRSRAARGAAVPRFAGRRRGHPQRRHDFRHRRHARRHRSRCRHGAHARPARLDGEARRRRASGRRCRWNSPWSARRSTCTAWP